MRAPCSEHINCGCDSLQLTNYSSEDPDRLIFLGRHFGFDNPAPIIITTTTSGCTSFANSLIDQADGDWCALKSLQECEVQENLTSPCWTCRDRGGRSGLGFGIISNKPDSPEPGDPCCNPDLPQGCCCESDPSNPNDPKPTDGGGGGKDPTAPPKPPNPPFLVCNDEQTCDSPCPDGKVYTAVIPACQFSAPSKQQANAVAKSAACQKAGAQKICTDNKFGPDDCAVFCLDDENASIQLQASAKNGNPVSFQLTDGSLPTGMSMDANGKISGTPTNIGSSSGTVTITDSDGNTTTRKICMLVMGISTDSLPNGSCGTPYNAQLTGSGGYPPDTFSGVGLPGGLSVSSDGAISGTPSEVGDFNPIFTLTDSRGNSCDVEIEMTITGTGNNAKTKSVPCLSGGSPVSKTIPAGSYCAPAGPDAQDIADSMADSAATNQAIADLQSAGCGCYAQFINTPSTPDYNAAWLNIINDCTRALRVTGPFDHVGGTNLGGSVTFVMATAGPWSWCQIFQTYTGLGCNFITPGQIFHLSTQSGLDLGWYIT